MFAKGKWYRLSFPGTWARVLLYDPRSQPHSWLVETWLFKDKWWVDEEGRPNNHWSPYLTLPRS
jgi:hypothetical protein